MKFTIYMVFACLVFSFVFSFDNAIAQRSLNFSTAVDIGSASADPINIFGVPDGVRGVTFSPDGMNLYVLNRSAIAADLLSQYSLTSPFDVSTATTPTFQLDVGLLDGEPSGFTFNSDGTRLFYAGATNDMIYQYDLMTPFELGSAVASANTLDVAAQDGTPSGLAISPDGTTLFMMGSVTDFVYQYNLNVAGELLGTSSILSFDVGPQETGAVSLQFNENGTRMFVIGTTNRRIFSYSLSNPYDFTTPPVFSGLSLDVGGEDTAPRDLFIDNTGTRLFIAGDANDQVYGYDLSNNAFIETGANDGTVQGSMIIRITGETFISGTLDFNVNYTIANLPNGLVPSAIISPDLRTAVLTLSGSADDHDNTFDVNDLALNFLDGAFTGGNAATVLGNGASGLRINFTADLAPGIAYSAPLDISTGIADATNVLSGIDANVRSVAFSNDGMVMFALSSNGSVSDRISQYALSAPYDLSSVASPEFQFIVSFIESDPTSIVFNNAGDRLYITGTGTDLVQEFIVEEPFDLRTAFLSGNSFDVTGEVTNPVSMRFSADGTRLFVLDNISDAVHQYNLLSSFNLIGAAFSGNSASVAAQENTPSALAFNSNGTRMFVAGTASDRIHSYELTSGFDFTTPPVSRGVNLDVSAEDGSPQGIFLDPTGTRLFMIGDVNESVFSYDITSNTFVETGANDGSVLGEMIINLSGDSFTNAGLALTLGTDFLMGGVPNGLVPAIDVAADGQSATLTLTGNADNHSNIDDVTDLVVEFQNSAFVGNAATAIPNSQGGISGLGIDFTEDIPAILEYSTQVDVSTGVFDPTNTFTSIDANARDLSFSGDGMVLYTLSSNGTVSDRISQFPLTSPFDVSSATTPDFQLIVAFEEPDPTGFTFNTSGTRMYLVGTTNDEIYEYRLNAPFDLSTAYFTGNSLDISGQEVTSGAISFSTDGTRLFLVGSTSDNVHQYNLTTPFELSTATFSTNSFSVSTEESAPNSLAFNIDGTRMFVTGTSSRRVHSYSLADGFDLSTPPTYQGVTLNVVGQDTSPNGIFIERSGRQLFMIGDTNDEVFGYNLNGNAFVEAGANDGSVQGGMIITLFGGETFASPGTVLGLGTDYNLGSIPPGLSPTVTVSADGLSAFLTLANSATDHNNINDVGDLQVDFLDGAFTSGNAAGISNAAGGSSGLAVDFAPDLPVELSYASAVQISAADLDVANVFTNTEASPRGVSFSADGLTMFVLSITAGNTDIVSSYSLSLPYDISGATTPDAQFIVGFEANDPTGIAFNPSGTRLYVVDNNANQVVEYFLSSPFDITTAYFSGNSFSVTAQEVTPGAIAFSPGGTKFFIVGSSSDVVLEYDLATAFDLSTAGFSGNSFAVGVQESAPTALAFNADGSRMFVTGTSSRRVSAYDLAAPFDLSTPPSFSGVTLDINGQDTSPQGIFISANGTQFFVLGDTNDDVFGYDLPSNAFSESAANDGAVIGSMLMTLSEESFAVPNSTLTLGTDYTVGTIPSGLVPQIVTSPDGSSATLTLSANADNHDNLNDLTNLQIDFLNPAFAGNSAGLVNNSVTGSSALGIDFVQNLPVELVYSAPVEISTGRPDAANVFAGGPASPRALSFSEDGMTLFILNAGAGNTDAVSSYSLTSPFDVSSALTPDFQLEVGFEDTDPTGLVFNPSGTRFYLLGNSSNTVFEYQLSTAFDLSTAFFTGNTLNVSAEEVTPAAMAFSQDGTRLFVVGASSDNVNQYNLPIAFDLNGATFSANSFAIGGQEANATSLTFNEDGSRMFVGGISSDRVHTYALSSNFDLSVAPTVLGTTLSVIGEDGTSQGIFIDETGTRLFMIGDDNDSVFGYDLTSNAFSESAANDGAVVGSLVMTLSEESFATPGSTLVLGTDYTVGTITTGLIPEVVTSSNGLSATLTLTGSADNHNDANDLTNLQIDFLNAAFTAGDASLVNNAVSGVSNIGIDFAADLPVELTYSTAVDISTGRPDASNVFANALASPRGLTFNNDGTILFIINAAAGTTDQISSYTLTSAYDVSSATTPDFQLEVGFEDADPTALAFNTSGTRLYVLGNSSNTVYEYLVSTAFDLSTASYTGNTLSVGTEEVSPSAMAFSLDGTHLFVTGGSSDNVNQYDLSRPFDLSSGGFSANLFAIGVQEANATSLAFNEDGSRMFVGGISSDRIHAYALPSNFDLSVAPTFLGTTLNLIGQDGNSQGIFIDKTGTRLFMVGDDNDDVYAYDLDSNVFKEAGANDGTVVGSMVMTLSEESFAAPGTSLILGTDYNMGSIPPGLVPDLAVSADGLSATLTLSGTADNHNNVNDVADLQVDFLDPAFSSSTAATVINAVSGSSSLGVDFAVNLVAAVSYASEVNIATAQLDAANLFTGVETNPRSVTFSSDGMTMFILSTGAGIVDIVSSYDLTTAFDVSTATAPSFQLAVGFEDDDPTGITFNTSGTLLYVLGNTTNRVHEYRLSTAFDLSSAYYTGNTLDIGTEEVTPTALAFSPDGTALFVTGASSDNVNQYDLSVAFDLTTASFSGNSLAVGLQDASPSSLAFNENGTRMFMAGSNTDRIYAYSITNGFDLSSPSQFNDVILNVLTEDNTPQGIFLDRTGTRLFMVGDENDNVFAYDLDSSVFREAATNDGTVVGAMIVSLTEETFSSPGATLTLGTDYNMGTVPAGLVPDLQVSTDGSTAVLTLSGAADNHDDINDVPNLQLDFLDPAFAGGNAASLVNAVGGTSQLAVNFDADRVPSITYSTDVLISTARLNESNIFTNVTNIPGAVRFSPDGMRMFVITRGAAGADQVLQYALSSPYDISSAASPEVTLDVSLEEGNPTDMVFNGSGTRLFVAGNDNDEIYEYLLPSPFDVTDAFYTGNFLNVSAQELSLFALQFSNDGRRLFIAGSTSDNIHQYDLTVAYDLTTATFSGNSFAIGLQEVTLTSFTFTADGSQLFLVGSNSDRIFSYSLASRFDLSTPPQLTGVTLNVAAEDTSPQGIFLDPTGTRLFMVGDANDNVVSYDLSQEAFVEAADNAGRLNGSIRLTIQGDTFGAPGTQLTNGTDYAVDNLPAGFIPILSVTTDGQFADLTLSGAATNHSDVDDVGGLAFTFQNSAFVGADAALINNSQAANSGLGIDYTQDDNRLLFSVSADLSTAQLADSLDVSADATLPTGMSFNDDGTRLFVVDRTNRNVFQYNMTIAYDVANAVLDTMINVGFEELNPNGIAFNPAGTRMFILGTTSRAINEYLLSTPFEITSASFTGNTFDVSTEDSSPTDLYFSPDGSILMMIGSTNDQVFRYNLAVPFDLSSAFLAAGGNFSVAAQETLPTSITFNLNGTRMYVAGNAGSTSIFEYTLATGFDLTTATFSGTQLNTLPQDSQPEGLFLDNTGTRLFFVGSNTDRVIAYQIPTVAFAENAANDGTVDGEMIVRVLGDQFFSAGSDLILDTGFGRGNIPDGLTPTVTVGADGFTATLNLADAALPHDNINDIGDIELQFLDGAFFGGDATAIANANPGTSGGLTIDFFGPTATSDLRTIEVSTTQIDLTWLDLSTDETSFAIFRSTGDNTNFTEIDEIPANSVSYSDVSVTEGNSYFYRVLSRNATGDSSPGQTRAAAALGDPGHALDFDGIDDFVSVPSLNFPAGSFSLEVWFNYTGAAPSGFETLIEFGNDEPFFGLSNGSVTLFNGGVTSPTPIIPGVWTNAVVTYDAVTEDVSLYINGELVSQANQPLSFIGQGMGIGQNSGDTPFQGLIDEVRIWEVARTEAEIQGALLTDLSGFETGLLAYYKFDQTTSGFGLLPDRSINQHDGTLTNFNFNGFDAGSDWATSAAFQISLPDAVALDASDIMPLAFTANWEAIPTISNYTLDVSTDDAFTNLVAGFDNTVIAGTSTSVTGLDYRTDYFYRVRGIIAPGDTTDFSNTIAVTTTTSPGTVADSTALTRIYNSLDGPNWARQMNWTVPDTRIEDWEGVTVVGDRVVAVDLNTNNLSGDLPVFSGEELDQMTNWNLSDNGISSLSDLSSLISLTDLDVRNNFLSFESIEPNIGIINAEFSPQNLLLMTEDIALNEGEDVVLDRVIGGTSNNYTWFRDGAMIAGGEDGTLELTAVSFTEEGDYDVEVTNSITPGITLMTNVITLRVSSLERDSTALRAIFDAMGGPDWTGRDNWQPAADMPVSNWEGVTIVGNRVVGLDLSGSNVVGTLPTDVLDIINLETINLSDNRVDSIPSLSALGNLTSLDVTNNFLQFDDLEANAGLGAGLLFLGQQLGDTPMQVDVDATTDFTVAVMVRGANNAYQWSLEGMDIAGANATDFLIEAVGREDQGNYVCVISNPGFPGLEFTSAGIDVTAVADVSGFARIAGQDGQFLTDGLVRLLAVRPDAYDTLRADDPFTLSAGGAYLYENVPLDDYLIVVDPTDRDNFLPTYYEQIIQWDAADTLFLNTDTTNIDVLVEPQPTDVEVGAGSLGGEIFTDFPEDGRLEVRRRVRRVGCALRRRRGQGRPEGRRPNGRVEMDDDGFELFSYQTTDDNGEFTFENLPVGTYRLFIEYPGIPLDPDSFTEFEVGENPNEDDFAVQVTVFEDGILIEEVDVVSVLEEFVETFKVFPNPADGAFFIELSTRQNAELTLEMIDLRGSVILTESIGGSIVTGERRQVDLSGISPGIYLIRLTVPELGNQQFKVGKLIVTEQ